MNGWAALFDDAPSPGALRWRLAAILTLLAVLWNTTRPYMGVIHDSLLYTVQALNAVYPGRFEEDMFFKYGSQDNFTLFSKLYAPLIAALGVAHAHMVAAALGQVLWLAALYWLVTALFDDGKTRLAAAVGAILLSPSYSAYGIFSYGERFATPRIFVESGVMAALALMLGGRWVAAWLLVGFAALIHPIMAATGGAMLALIAIFRDRRAWLLAGCGFVLVLGAAFAGIDPFHRLFARFDDAWFEVIRQRARQLLPSQWGGGGLAPDSRERRRTDGRLGSGDR